MRLWRYYVSLQRIYLKEDYINIWDQKEAIEHYWIDSEGNRIWAV